MTESQNRLNDLNECIRNHLGGGTICLNACELRMTSDSGCGVFATQDICANDVLFVDKPLVLGPTGNQNEPIVCVMCYEIIDFDVKSHLCSGQCGLILCGKIECFEKHKAECLLFQKWKPKNPNELSFTKCKALLVIRSLFLNEKQRKFLDLMQKHGLKDDLHFANEFVRFPQDKETVGVLSAASAAMNVNAFKIPYRAYTSTAGVGVRGFFPIMSLINHKCSPNARPDIDRNFVNRVLATVPIRKNEQIFITYSQLLWATNSRRMHMMASKQFLCICNRCIDPTEFSTNLSAIKCQDKNCNGIVLPIESINFKSDAKCNECQSICDNKRFLQIQEMTARITKVFVNTKFSLDELKYFVEMRLHKLVPDSNQFVFEAKLKAVWKCEAVAKEDLITMKCYSEEILRALDKLQVGECSLKGFLSYKLYNIRQKLKTLHQSTEKSERESNDTEIQSKNSEYQKMDVFLNDDMRLQKTARTILMNNSAAPVDIILEHWAD